MTYYYEIRQAYRHVMFCKTLESAHAHAKTLEAINNPVFFKYKVRPVPASQIKAFITAEGEVKSI